MYIGYVTYTFFLSSFNETWIS